MWCPDCSGTGQIGIPVYVAPTYTQGETTCRACGGSGLIGNQPCMVCSGHGVVDRYGIGIMYGPRATSVICPRCGGTGNIENYD